MKSSQTTSPKIYALLIGIDDYPMPIPPLKGCKKDVERVGNFIRRFYSDYKIQVLEDSDATRSNIINAIRSHLGNAQRDDIALLYYAGHGGIQKSAPEFAEFYRSGYEETLICFDSRTINGRDLSDKELAILFNEIDKNGPHFIAIFDCCHSGGLTRKLDRTKRAVGIRDGGQQLGNYLDGFYLSQPQKSLHIPESKMLKISASSNTQAAHETVDFGGLFTYHLIQVLEASGPNISYATLFQRIRRQLAIHRVDQNPEFEAHKGFDPYTRLLNGESLNDRENLQIYFENNDWWIDRGALDGIPTGHFLNIEVGDQVPSPIQFPITAVGPERSLVGVNSNILDRQKRYKVAILNYLPTETFVAFEGPEPIKNELQIVANTDPFLKTVFVDASWLTEFKIKWEYGDLWLFHAPSQTRIQGVGHDPTESEYHNRKNMVIAIFVDLKKALRWQRGINLQNEQRQEGKMNIEFQVEEFKPNGEKVIHSDFDLEFQVGQPPKYPEKIKLKFQVKNLSDHPLFFTFLNYFREYGIQLVRKELIMPGTDFTTLYGESSDHNFVLHDHHEKNTDICQLIVSREPIDDFLIVQQPFQMGRLNNKKRHLNSLEDRSYLVKNWVVFNWHVKLARKSSYD